MHETREALVKFLTVTIAERDLTMKTASEAIHKNHAYLQQFIRKGTPHALPEDVRHNLARVLQVPEQQLRVRGPRELKDSATSAEQNTPVAGAVIYGRGDPMIKERLDLIEDIANLPSDLLPTVRALLDRIKGIQQSAPPGPRHRSKMS